MKPKLEFIKTNLQSYTFNSPRIKEYVEKMCIGRTLNLFAGKIKLNINEYRVDIDNTYSPDVNLDAYEFIKNTNESFDTILLDPPYSYRKSMEYYNGNYTSKFKLIADEIRLRGYKRVISFGYHTTFMGKIRGYELTELCVLAHSGAQHATIVLTEDLTQGDL